jgi:hypothetical protein
MQTKKILLIGGLGLIAYWLYKRSKNAKNIIDLDPPYQDVKNMGSADIKKIANPISDEPTMVDTKNKTIVLDLNKDRERKKFSQIIPEDVVRDYNTSKEETIMNRRIGVKII